MKAECGILESDSPAEAEAKLDEALPADDRTAPGCRPAWRRSSGRRREPAAQEESFAAWRRFFEMLAAERDDGACLRGSALGRSCAARLSRAPGRLGGGRAAARSCARRGRSSTSSIRHFGANARNAQRINLAPLSDAETAHLVSALLEQAVLPAETQQALLERAGGNPLYAEEFVRLLADRGRRASGARCPIRCRR